MDDKMQTGCGYNGPERRKSCDFAEEAADRAAEKAVKKAFFLLDIDIDNKDEIEKFRSTMRMGGRFNTMVDKASYAAIGILLVLIMVEFGERFFMIIKDKILNIP